MANAGSVQFSTYYPAPFGMYDRLRLVPRTALTPPCDPGTMYINADAGNQLEVCNAAGNAWAPLSGGPWTETTPNIYATNTAANVGIGTATPRVRLELGNDGAILTTGTFGSGWTEPNLGAGTRLIWYPSKAAFRAGTINGTQWDNANIGNSSVAMGNDTTASGTESLAAGDNSTASGSWSIAIGHSTKAGGLASTAFGQQTDASGDYATALGNITTAQAYASTVLGQYNVIAGSKTTWVATDPLFVIGNGTNAASTSNALTVLKNGSVGIGTTTPQAKLDVSGGVLIVNNEFFRGRDTSGNGWIIGGIVGNNILQFGSSAVGAPPIEFYTNVSPPAMIINTNRNVGIGTTTPANKLDVAGGMAVGATYSGTTAAPTNGMIVEGDVGIGTNAPGAKLDVQGGYINAGGGLVIQTTTMTPATLTTGQIWLCTDTGDATPCNGI